MKRKYSVCERRKRRKGRGRWQGKPFNEELEQRTALRSRKKSMSTRGKKKKGIERTLGSLKKVAAAKLQ